MAIGKSHRIVIEVDPRFKEKIYEALRKRGMTLKEWFLEEANRDLVSKQCTRTTNFRKKGE